jgi:hypothetical protein
MKGINGTLEYWNVGLKPENGQKSFLKSFIVHYSLSHYFSIPLFHDSISSDYEKDRFPDYR